MVPGSVMVPGKTKRRFWAKFHLFSAYIPPIFHLWYPIRCFSAHMFTEFAYFCLFPSIFCLKWYPILVINTSMEPICCFPPTYVYGVCLFSTYFQPNLQPIFHRSCLAGYTRSFRHPRERERDGIYSVVLASLSLKHRPIPLFVNCANEGLKHCQINSGRGNG